MPQVVVCGAGVIGASVAYYLSLKGIQPTIVDAVGPACSASGKAGGFLARDWCDGSSVGPLARKSFALHAELAEKLGGKERYGYRKMTTYSVSIRPGGGRRRGRQSTQALTWLRPENLVQSSLISTPENCAQVHPELFTRALIEEVQAAGGQVQIGTLCAMQVEGGAVVGVTLASRDGSPPVSLPADVVVFATGAWTGRLRSIASRLPAIQGQKAHSILLADQTAGGLPPEALFLAFRGTDGKSQEPEIYPRPDGHVYVCGASSDTPLPEFADQVVTDPGAGAGLCAVAAASAPALDGAALVREQACYLPCSPDGVPVIGALPGVRGAYVAAGHSCWGILNAPATGAALAELIADGAATCLSLAPFDPARL